MSAINALTVFNIALLPQTCSECVTDHADTHVPVTRIPVVSARWKLELNPDGSCRLMERWSINQRTEDETEPPRWLDQPDPHGRSAAGREVPGDTEQEGSS